jgi:hypothetical protein
MSHPSKVKGNKYERDVADYLRDAGWPGMERIRAGWTDDRGDLDGIIGFTVECKNHRSLDLAGWCAELDVEMRNAGNTVGAVIHKKRGTTDVGEHYATLPVRVLVQLLKEAGYQ